MEDNVTTSLSGEEESLALKQISSDEKAKRFLKLKSLKDEINQEYNFLRDELLRSTKQLGIRTLKTDNYTISRVNRTTVYINDENEAANELISRDLEVEWVKNLSQASQHTIKQLAKENELSGVSKKETEYVTVRVNKEA